MEPFLGEIRLLPYSYAPKGWALCQGQILPIAQNTTLFSLLGVQYGGNGTSTFALPNLQGRAIVGMGQGGGLQPYSQGAVAGTETVTLQGTEMPAHIHGMSVDIPVSSGGGSSSSPANAYFASTQSEQYGASADNGTMANNLFSGNTGTAGGNQPHENRMPFLVLNYCIALLGVYPQRP